MEGEACPSTVGWDQANKNSHFPLTFKQAFV